MGPHVLWLRQINHPIVLMQWEFFGKPNYPAACTNLPITFLGRTEIASENTSIFPYIGVIKFGLKDNSRQNDVYLCVFNGSINTVFLFVRSFF